MSITQACGEPEWYMKQENQRAFGDPYGTFADLNGVYTVTGLAQSSDDSNIITATVDGVAIQAGDLVFLKDQGDLSYTCGSSWSTDVTITENGETVSMRDIHTRLQRLESQVELWKSAAMTLAELNRELTGNEPMPRVRIHHEAMAKIEEDPISAYERAKKATK